MQFNFMLCMNVYLHTKQWTASTYNFHVNFRVVKNLGYRYILSVVILQQ